MSIKMNYFWGFKLKFSSILNFFYRGFVICRKSKDKPDYFKLRKNKRKNFDNSPPTLQGTQQSSTWARHEYRQTVNNLHWASVDWCPRAAPHKQETALSPFRPLLLGPVQQLLPVTTHSEALAANVGDRGVQEDWTGEHIQRDLQVPQESFWRTLDPPHRC